MKLIVITTLTLVALIFAHSHPEKYRKNIYVKYRNSVKLDTNYTLLWTLTNRNKTVNFALDCKTKGWVGLGFSLHGKMAPSSDFFMTYIDTKGKVHYSDRYSLKKEEPKTDEELGGTNDFRLVSAKEENGRYLIEFSRDVVTKDRFDVPILLEGNTNVIWAYSFSKPINVGDPLRIHNRFGSTEVTFGVPGRERPLPDKDIVKTSITVNNYKLTNDVTQYICKNFKHTEIGLKEESHAVKFDPIIDNAQVLHHMILYECPFEVDTSKPIYDCLDDMPKCEMAYGWAVGAKSFFLPPKAGVRIGGKRNNNYILQIHYDNPDRERGHIDSSGVMIYSTKHFRQFDAGVLTLGYPMRRLNIPPKREHFPVVDICENSCATEKFFVFAYAFHMHLIGAEIETKLFRNGKEIGQIENTQWDFDNQETVRLQREVTIHKGDQFYTKCVFNSMNRTSVTRGGFPSHDEMCFNFVSYYPRKVGPANCLGNRCRLPKD